MVAAAKASVVTITADGMTTDRFSPFGQPTRGIGSGIVLTADGYILTNRHVTENSTSLSVEMSDGTTYPATLVEQASDNDLALIKVDATGLTPARIADSKGIDVGETAIAIGSPLGTYTETVTKGIVSALDRDDHRRRRVDRPPGPADRPHPDRRRDQPRQQRRPAARRHGRGHRHQHGGRVHGPGPGLRDPDQRRVGAHRPRHLGPGGLSTRPAPAPHPGAGRASTPRTSTHVQSQPRSVTPMKLKLFVIVLLVVAGGAAVAYSVGGLQLAGTANATQYLTSPATTGDVTDSVAATGTIAAHGGLRPRVRRRAGADDGLERHGRLRHLDGDRGQGRGRPGRQAGRRPRHAPRPRTCSSSSSTPRPRSARPACRRSRRSRPSTTRRAPTPSGRRRSAATTRPTPAARRSSRSTTCGAQIRYATLVAPIDGTITAVNIGDGPRLDRHRDLDVDLDLRGHRRRRRERHQLDDRSARTPRSPSTRSTPRSRARSPRSPRPPATAAGRVTWSRTRSR